MSASVKMGEEEKRLLEKLQARYLLITGRKVSQQELLDLIVRFSTEREEELFGLMTGVKLPLPLEDIEEIMELPQDWGVETREEEIDVYLYGRGNGKPPEKQS